MSIRKKDKLDLELMSYTDIAYEIIKEDKKQYNTPNLFKEVCSLLELGEDEFESKIGEFFTALSTCASVHFPKTLSPALPTRKMSTMPPMAPQATAIK